MRQSFLRWAVASAVAGGLMFAGSAAFALEISGVVKDSEGKVVARAMVTAFDDSIDRKITVYADDNGKFLDYEDGRVIPW